MSTTTAKIDLDERRSSFIRHWGEMGSRWGIARAVAQIHALLLVSERPLHAQEICEILGLARSNVSTGLRELEGWGVVSLVHVLGDRRDHFETKGDVWQMFFTIADKRIEKEIEPTLTLLNQLDGGSKPGKKGDHFAGRIHELREFVSAGVSFYRRIRSMPLPMVKKLITLDSRISKMLTR